MKCRRCGAEATPAGEGRLDQSDLTYVTALLYVCTNEGCKAVNFEPSEDKSWKAWETAKERSKDLVPTPALVE
jgi:hypothetical protein